MRRSISALLLLVVVQASTACGQDYWTARSFRNRVAADRFIQQLERPIARRSAMVVPLQLRGSARNIHVVYLADARVEDPNVPRTIGVQNCQTVDGIFSCAGTHAWMAAAGQHSILISVPGGDAVVLFDRTDFDVVTETDDADDEGGGAID